MSQNARSALVGIGIAVLLGLGVWWYSQNAFTHPLPLAAGDSIASWDFQGTYNDGGELEKRARDEIARSEGLLGGDQSGANNDPTDYELYVAIANQYSLLGDGKRAYEHLGKAVAIDPVGTGLAWYNLGVLTERLGAYNTARVAYGKAVAAQPHIDQYQAAYIQFLITRFPEDPAVIEAAFLAAKAATADAPLILQLEAEWNKR